MKIKNIQSSDKLVSVFALFSVAFVLFFSFAGLVSSAGVSAPYWDSAGNEKALIVSPGEAKDIEYSLQNLVGDKDIRFTARIINSSDIASFADANTTYIVPVNTSQVKVKVHIKIPENAEVGKVFKIRTEFVATPLSEAGQLQIASGYIQSFDVVVQEKKPGQITSEENFTQAYSGAPSSKGLSIWIYWVIGAVVLIVIIFIILKIIRKPKTIPDVMTHDPVIESMASQEQGAPSDNSDGVNQTDEKKDIV